MLLSNITIIPDAVVQTAHQLTFLSPKPFWESNVEISVSSYKKKLYEELIIPSGNFEI